MSKLSGVSGQSPIQNQGILVDINEKPVGEDYKGRKYRLVKSEVPYSTFERIKRGLLGILATVSSLGIAYFASSRVRDLFSSTRIRSSLTLVESDQRAKGGEPGAQQPKVGKVGRTSLFQPGSSSKKQFNMAAYLEEWTKPDTAYVGGKEEKRSRCYNMLREVIAAASDSDLKEFLVNAHIRSDGGWFCRSDNKETRLAKYFHSTRDISVTEFYRTVVKPPVAEFPGEEPPPFPGEGVAAAQPGFQPLPETVPLAKHQPLSVPLQLPSPSVWAGEEAPLAQWQQKIDRVLTDVRQRVGVLQSGNPDEQVQAKMLCDWLTMMERLKERGNPLQHKKLLMCALGMEEFLRGPLVVAEVRRMDSASLSRFVQKTAMGVTRPPFLAEQFSPKHANVNATSKYYNYELSPEYQYEVFVDFANQKLGGGCFHDERGSVQEEIMTWEMPNFAGVVAGSTGGGFWSQYRTREGGAHSDQPGNGNPVPLILENVVRVQEMENRVVYAERLDQATFDLVRQASHVQARHTVNLLAIAAPHLRFDKKTTPLADQLRQQHDSMTLQDIFTTLMAGFTAVKEQAHGREPVLIHSGKFGCGAFNNDPRAVYFLHRLAAEQAGVDVMLYGYRSDEVQANDTEWGRIRPLLENKTLGECMNIIGNEIAKVDREGLRV